MLKKTIKYKNFNDEWEEEDFFFHLSKAELVELEASHEDGLASAMQRIVDANDTKSIIAEFKKIIMQSYGIKSSDGKRFVKNQTIREAFESSEAYSTLFMELVTDTDAAIEFMNGIIPGDLVPEEEPAKPKVEPVYMTMREAKELDYEEYRELSERIVLGQVVIVDELDK